MPVRFLDHRLSPLLCEDFVFARLPTKQDLEPERDEPPSWAAVQRPKKTPATPSAPPTLKTNLSANASEFVPSSGYSSMNSSPNVTPPHAKVKRMTLADHYSRAVDQRELEKALFALQPSASRFKPFPSANGPIKGSRPQPGNGVANRGFVPMPDHFQNHRGGRGSHRQQRYGAGWRGERESQDCTFCKENGKPRDIYFTHSLRNPTTKEIICPFLKEDL